MKFLADAHISAEMVAMIRAMGHDCLDSSVIPPRMSDLDILQMAANENRVIITADKDFGELVFVYRIACPGVILIRLTIADESQRVLHVQSVWPKIITRLPASFIVVGDGSIRFRRLS